MLDFNEVFWHADKRGKIRGKLRILEFFLQTRCVADGAHVDTTHCGRRSQNTEALCCRRGLFARLYQYSQILLSIVGIIKGCHLFDLGSFDSFKN